MSGPVFVDRNVVYRHSALERRKQARADNWYKLLWKLRLGRLSFQILQGTYSTPTRKLAPAAPDSDARAIIQELVAWNPEPVNFPTLERA